MASSLQKIATGFRGRTLKTTRLLAKGGLALAKRNFIGESGSSDDSKHVAAAQRLFDELDGLKGLVMKFGQMASYLDHSLPPEAQKILARLQSDSQAMTYDAVAAVVEEELGDRPDVVFDEFEPEPFAAASIGQVHRAVYQGRPVAVKVQYPGITDALESDLKWVGRFARLGFMLSTVDGSGLAAELRDRITEECDYTQEASNQMLFHRMFAGDKHRTVPRVIAERSTRRILTSELDAGQRFQEFADSADQETRSRAGTTIFGTCFTSIFRDCVFNADPHPGNYLFDGAGTVTFLDFGCLKWFEPELINNWKAVARTLLNDDKDHFPQALTNAGLVGRAKNFDWDYQWQAMSCLYEPLKAGRPTRFTGELIERANAMNVFDNPNKMRLNLPPDWLFVNRLQFGLLSVLAQLGAEADWGKLFRAAVDGPTRPLARPKS